MDYTVHGILQARILEWVAIPFSRGSSQPRDQTQVSCIAGGSFTSWAIREAHLSSEVHIISTVYSTPQFCCPERVQTFTCTKLNSLCPSQNHTSSLTFSGNGNSIFPISQTKNLASVLSHNSNPIMYTGHSMTIHLVPVSCLLTSLPSVSSKPPSSCLNCCSCLLTCLCFYQCLLFYSQSSCQCNPLKPDEATSFFKIRGPPSESETKVLQEVSLSLSCLSLTVLAHLFFLEHTHNVPSCGLCTGCSLCLQSFLETATWLTASATLSGAQMSFSIKSTLV